MATRLFAISTGTAGTYTISPAPDHYKDLIATTFGGAANGNGVVLAAGAEKIRYVLTPSSAASGSRLPGASGSVVGQFVCYVSFQTITPTNIYTKVRVHRGTLSGSVITLVNSSAWSGEVLTNKTAQRFALYVDQVDLGTWATTDFVVFEYNYRNAGAASLTPQPTGGGFYRNAIYTPFETSAAYGYVNQAPVGQRPYIYSQGGIRGTSRYLKQTTSVNTSNGTATGTKGGQDFSGSVTGVSTSSGTIAAGKQGYTGSSTGSSVSSGTVAAGAQGYTGSSTGSSTSSGTVNGTPGPGPTPDEGVAVPWWYIQQERQPQPKPLQIVALTGSVRIQAVYATGRVRGRVGLNGSIVGANRVESFITSTSVGYSGTVPPLRLVADGRLSRGRVFTTNELLILMGEL